MSIYITQSFSHQLVLFYKIQHFLVPVQLSFGEGVQESENFLTTKTSLAWAYYENDMFQEILELYDYDETSGVVQLILYRMGKLGSQAEALAMVDLSAELFTSFELALFCAELGADSDQVFKYLRKALEERNGYLTYVKMWSSFDDYRSDPRYKELLKKMGLD